MAAHWKYGHGFAIRYGGYRDIQWFKGEEFEHLSQAFSPQASSFSPVEMAIEASKSVALFLQWWEMRKQTLLQRASFEERRIIWLADILAEWHAEIQQGIMRLDTAHYLDRELSRLLGKLRCNDLIDTPSSLLLHIERAANLLVRINQTINCLLLDRSPNFLLPDLDIPQPFQYQPYFRVEQDTKKFGEYIASVNSLIETSPLSALSSGLGAGIVDSLVGGSWTSMIIGGILWTVPMLLEARAKMKSKSDDRLQDFIALQHLSIELRSTNCLLRLAQKSPPFLKVYSPDEIENNGPGQLMLMGDTKEEGE